jgi:hypothetical protein
VGCNLEYAPPQWNNVRARAQTFNVKVFPWVRLAHVNHGDTFENVKERLSLLVLTAQVWGVDTIIPNYENEADTFSPAEVQNHLRNVLDWDGDTGWSTQAWLPNAPDFLPMANDSVLLQVFPTDNRWTVDEIEQRQGDCVAHARDKGFTYVGVTYQTYGSATPGWYDVASHQHSTFPGNLIQHGQWDEWYA